jgi:hypothetical protein
MRTADNPLSTLTQLEDRLLLSATLLNAGATDMVYDAAGALHVAYYDTADHTLKYTARSPAGNWGPAITLDPTPYAGAELAIALDATGRPAVAYYDATNRDLKFAQKTRRGCTLQTLDAAGTVGHNPSLAFTPDGFPLVSYYAASTAYAPPALPTPLVATRLDDGRVQLTWDDPTGGAAGYALSFARGNQPVDSAKEICPGVDARDNYI